MEFDHEFKLLSQNLLGTWSLPWHVAWIAPFGQKGWFQAFDWAYKDGWSKQEVLKAVGPPDLMHFNGFAYEPDKVDLYKSRPREIWTYWSPSDSSSGAAIIFISNKVAKR